MRVSKTSDNVTVVLIGSFNPSIFHPSWLALHNLISAEALEAQKLQVTHPDISRFEVNYMAFDIQLSRVAIGCEAAKDGLVKDMVTSIFGDLLPHSPVWSMGINRTIEFLCGTEEKRNALGKEMAPQEAWGRWGSEIALNDGKRHGGMTRLVMRQTPRSDGRAGHFQAEIQPGLSSTDSVRLEFNSELVFGKPDECKGAHEAIELLDKCWDVDLRKAEEIAEELMAKIDGMVI